MELLNVITYFIFNAYFNGIKIIKTVQYVDFSKNA
jgi:hypothetical protein